MPAPNMGSPLGAPPDGSNGKFVIANPFSAPTGSPMDTDVAPSYSTGALNTGIGIGANVIINAPADPNVKNAGFTSGASPGMTMPDQTQAPDARLTCIGGGRSNEPINGDSSVDPYPAQPILGFGNGTLRDAGSGPEFTGHAVAMIAAGSDTPDGDNIDEDYVNRSGTTVLEGQSVFGSDTRNSPPIGSVAVTGVTITSPDPMENPQGLTQLTWEISPLNATNQGVSFESADETICTIDSSGQITGLLVGSTTVTVTTDDGGFQDSITVNVTSP